MATSDIVTHFLYCCGWGAAQQTTLPSDASRRQYTRLSRNGATALLMDARYVREVITPFVQIGNYLREQGFSAPEVYAVDDETGLALIEDFGDTTFYACLEAGTVEAARLFEDAVDLLIAFQTIGGEHVVPLYDAAFLHKELGHFLRWYLPLTGVECTEEMQRGFVESWEGPLAYLIDTSPQRVFVHKDFHGGNLLWLPHRSGIARVGIIDFQSAKYGFAAYDLIALLYDCRKGLDDDLRRRLLETFLTRSCTDPGVFFPHCHILMAQRNVKILGDFARVCLEDARPDYLTFLPSAWKLILNSLAEPLLADVKYWFDHYGILDAAAKEHASWLATRPTSSCISGALPYPG